MEKQIEPFFLNLVTVRVNKKNLLFFYTETLFYTVVAFYSRYTFI